MDSRLRSIAAMAAEQHSVVSLAQLEGAGVSRSLRHDWVTRGLLDRLGPRSLSMAGAEPTWMRSLVAAYFDRAPWGYVAGRSASRLYGLDGFGDDHVELIVSRAHRGARTSAKVPSTSRPITWRDVRHVGCLKVLAPERLILDAPLFGFSRVEIENAIDSALRLRLISEQRLRERVVAEHSPGVNGSRMLIDALIDTGGESVLERRFLKLVRSAGLPRPTVQKVFREGGRTVARVDAIFANGLVVELAGHATHATRRQRQHDAQRHTELTLRGLRVLTFTYEDVRDRPEWVVARVREALQLAA